MVESRARPGGVGSKALAGKYGKQDSLWLNVAYLNLRLREEMVWEMGEHFIALVLWEGKKKKQKKELGEGNWSLPGIVQLLRPTGRVYKKGRCMNLDQYSRKAKSCTENYSSIAAILT